VEAAFPLVVIVICVVAIVVAFATFVGAGKIYENLGRGAFALDESDRPTGPEPGSSASRAEADAEIRQMLEAKSARREARGEAPLDIEAEMAELTAPAGSATGDDELRDEVRQLVLARNERRVARGQEPLDVEAEVDRQLRDLGA
jgi:cytochrome P450